MIEQLEVRSLLATILDVRVDSSSDDAEERAAGNVKLTSSDLEMVFDKSDQTVGMRFDGLTVPQAAIVVNAHVQFQADDGTLENNLSNLATSNITINPIIEPLTAGGSCLDDANSIITLVGEQTERFNETGLPDGTAVDATGARWFAVDDTLVKIEDSPNFCFHNGVLQHNFPEDVPWSESKGARGMRLYNSPNAIIEGTRFTNSGDGISIFAGSSDFTIRGVLFEDMRDDAIESDDLEGGLIEDVLIESTWAAFAARARSGDNFDGSNNTWTIRDTLVRLRPQIGVWDGDSPGHGGFFKWEEVSPQLEIHDSIFRVDQLPNAHGLDLDPNGKLRNASNNIIIWLGEGDYPETIPPGFTLSNDVSIWDNAVTQWMVEHGFDPGLPGDANGDGVVNAADYTIWGNHFGMTANDGEDLPGDFNGDDIVNAADYTIWGNNFGDSLPGAETMASGPSASQSVSSFHLSAATSESSDQSNTLQKASAEAIEPVLEATSPAMRSSIAIALDHLSATSNQSGSELIPPRDEAQGNETPARVAAVEPHFVDQTKPLLGELPYRHIDATSGQPADRLLFANSRSIKPETDHDIWDDVALKIFESLGSKP